MALLREMNGTCSLIFNIYYLCYYCCSALPIAEIVDLDTRKKYHPLSLTFE